MGHKFLQINQISKNYVYSIIIIIMTTYIPDWILQKYNVSSCDSKYVIIDDTIKSRLLDDSPFYVVDLEKLVEQFTNWKRLLPMVDIYYAVKANPTPIILEVLSSLGVNFDCASKNEIEIVMKITENDSSRIIFANPCKSPSHIHFANQSGVEKMTFDSTEELYKIKNIFPTSKLILRIAVDDSKSLCKFNKKYGAKMENVRQLFTLANHLGLEIVGISFHVGSGCSSGEPFYNALKSCKIVFDISKEYNIDISIIDIGGGFPGSLHGSFDEISENIRNGIHDFFGKETSVRFIAEPGRYFVESIQTLVICIIGKKRVKSFDDDDDDEDDDKYIYYLNDGLYGSFNNIIFEKCEPNICHRIKKDDNKLYASRLFGPTCDSMDMIYDSIFLPELEIGDYLYVPNFGAYTNTSASNFNGFTTDVFKYFYPLSFE